MPMQFWQHLTGSMSTKKITGKSKAYFALITTSIIWGTTWVASKSAITEIPALQMTSIRQLLAGSIFVLFFTLYKKTKLPTIRQFMWMAVMAVFMFVVANGLSTWGLKYVPTGLSALIGALYPLSVVLIEMVFFKKRYKSVLTFLGLFLGLIGIAIVFYENAFHQQLPGFFFGITLAVIAMLGWSTGTIFIARNKLQLNPYYAIGWQMLIGGVLLFFFAKATTPLVPLQNISLNVWLLIGYLVVAGSIVSFIAFIYSVKNLPVGIASLYAYINPIVAMIVAPFFIKNEHLTLYILWGALVTLTGVFLVNYSVKKNKIIAEPEQ